MTFHAPDSPALRRETALTVGASLTALVLFALGMAAGALLVWGMS